MHPESVSRRLRGDDQTGILALFRCWYHHPMVPEDSAPGREATHGESPRLEPTDRPAIEERLRHFLGAVAEGRGIATVYLFGSVARGTAHPRSDVDVAMLFDHDPPRTLAGLHLDLQADLEDHLGLPVQLVVLNRADADLVHNVLLDARLILDRDPGRRVDFEVRKRSEYFDLLPFLERYRHPERIA